MSSDAETREPAGPEIPERSLPEIVELVIERVPFEPPRYELIDSVYADFKEAVAFNIVIDDEIRVDQAVTPVLYVGEVEVSHLEGSGENRYRYLAFQDEERQMRGGDSIALGWPGLPAEKRETQYRFEPPPPLG